jgi:hypothetical protein
MMTVHMLDNFHARNWFIQPSALYMAQIICYSPIQFPCAEYEACNKHKVMFILTATEATKVTPRFILMPFPVSRSVGGRADLEPWEISDPFFLFILQFLRKFCVLLRNGQGDNSCNDRSSENEDSVQYLICEISRLRINPDPGKESACTRRCKAN